MVRNINIMEKKEKNNITNIEKAIQINKLLKDTVNDKGDKDKIIKILRDELNLIKEFNQKIILEKDKLISQLLVQLKEKDQTINMLKARLKRDANYEFL